MPAARLVPSYLQRYCKPQDYSRYTPREHATWRYILRQARDFFSTHAVPTYLEGLAKTGITIEAIPSIQHIDACLKQFEWGAVGVSGFIPPAAFLDFQSRNIMPIAMDMRTLEHMAYTPAPDIVHEAAGHIPILVEPSYRKYLSRYANMAKKAIISDEDVRLYEAIRALSDIKENPDTAPKEIKAAQEHLNETVASVKEITELAKVARMNWWTAEYGLVGSLQDPKIYGAGLLSSVGESRHCLTDAVKKIRLSIKCIDQSYDITEPQPQLFVAESLEQLPEVLEELDRTLSYRVGGMPGMQKALRSKSVNTIVLENGFSVSGVLETAEFDADKVIFVKLKGPVQLCFRESELENQGRAQHPSGFSSPLGPWKAFPGKCPSELSDSDLNQAGISKGKNCKLELASGFIIQGEVTQWVRKDGKLGILSWKNCTVTKNGQTYFQPDWGTFDQLIGSRPVSVHGGPGDREKYGEYDLGKVSTTPGRVSPFSEAEKKTFEFYSKIRNWRENKKGSSNDFQTLATQISKDSPSEWLLDLELVELTKQNPALAPDKSWIQTIEQRLADHGHKGGTAIQSLVNNGLRISNKS